jgi:MFS superfamily sulfate permease-like transporter
MATNRTSRSAVAEASAEDAVDWKQEALAGLTVWAVLVPTALAYSGVVGVEPIVGLVGVPLALVAYALLGGSRALVVGADAAVSVLVASVVGTAMAASGLAQSDYRSSVVVLSALVGLVFLLLRALRFGWIADLVPQPVLNGFVQGLAVSTILDQVPKLLGLQLGGHPKGFFTKLWETGASIGTISWPTAAIGMGALAIMVAVRVLRPRWPVAIATLALSCAIFAVFNLGSEGVTAVGEPVGSVFSPLHLPADLGIVWDLLPGALAIVVLGFTESLGASQLVSSVDGRPIDPNRELLGLGAANVGVAVGGSFAVTGALSKTSVALASGQRSQRGNLVAAAAAILTIIFLRPAFGYLPNSVLAAVVVWAMLGMIKASTFRVLFNGDRSEFIIAVVAGLGVLVLGIMPGAMAATLLSLILVARHVSRPPIALLTREALGVWHEVPGPSGGEPIGGTASKPGFQVCRVAGPIVFVNARTVADRVREIVADENVNVVVLDASSITGIDSTGIHELDMVNRSMAKNGAELWVARPMSKVWDHYVQISEAEGGKPVPIFDSLDDAYAAFVARAS